MGRGWDGNGGWAGRWNQAAAAGLLFQLRLESSFGNKVKATRELNLEELQYTGTNLRRCQSHQIRHDG